MLAAKHNHVAVCLLLLLLLVRSAFGYLLVVSDTDSPGLVLFDGGTPFYDRPATLSPNCCASTTILDQLYSNDH
jgi:hypothetical protein